MTAAIKAAKPNPRSNRMRNCAVILTVIAIIAIVIGLMTNWYGTVDNAKPAPGTIALVPQYGNVSDVATIDGDGIAKCNPTIRTVPLKQDGTVAFGGTRITSAWNDVQAAISFADENGKPVTAASTLGAVFTNEAGRTNVTVLSDKDHGANTFLIKNSDWGPMGGGKIALCMLDK